MTRNLEAAGAPDHRDRHGRRMLRRWRPALRLARRDAALHRARTILATLLIALPMIALVSGFALTQSTLPARDAALASIPGGAQAVVTATAVTRTGTPFPQAPEGAPGPWMDDTSQIPATQDELAAALPPGDRLLPFWNSPQLIATTGLTLAPGEQAKAGSSVTSVGGLDLAGVSTSTLQEAGAEAMAILLPKPIAGAAPSTESEVAITSALADRLNVKVGAVVAWVAPPFNGLISSDGRVGQVIQDSQRSYRVSGIVDGKAQKAWALEGWISRMVTADPAGVDGHWIVAGDEPVTWDSAKAINPLQAFAVSRHVLTNYPSAGELYPVHVDPKQVLLGAMTIALASTISALLVFFLVTPAFAVSAEQSRRTLGLASAAGATPSDLRRIILAQGIVVGAAGGLVGSVLGVATALIAGPLILPERDLLAHFPWWIVAISLGIAVVLGALAAVFPARTASRLHPVDAVKDRPTGRLRGHRRGATALRLLGDLVGPAALLAAGVFGAWSLRLSALVAPDHTVPGSIPPSASGLATLFALTLLLAVTGLLLCARSMTTLGARLAGRAPATLRFALRDASDHRSRFVPAATAVLIAVAAASYFAVIAGSTTANEHDRTGQMAEGERIVLGAQVPVTESFDRLVIDDAIHTLSEQLPVNGHEPIYSIPAKGGSVYLGAVPPANSTCPKGQAPDVASSIRVEAPLHCTDYERSYSPGLSVPWWGGLNTYVMGGDALRASGFPSSAEAATVLDEGGVVVNNAAFIGENGMVRVAISDQILPDESNAQRIVELPGRFVRGLAPMLTVSPSTAQSLGVPALEYLGEIVTTSSELSPAELDSARQLVEQHTTLVWFGQPMFRYPWGGVGQLILIGLLVLLAVAATTISLLLARTQSVRDFTTMHAVGAAPRFLRRVALTQAVVVISAGLPLGLIAGIALGTYQIAWNRAAQIGGAWLETAPLWGIQAALAASVVGVGLTAALLVTRPPRNLMRRAID